ncbi:hypothetical protein SAMN02745146_0865 [Hymenobacter daecheongensis DSM 21074]|uniref:ATP-binding protein n=1 Tax=Hymenobacter daecheongensis DSM 21074 TaxID=1121955 RepID=A0A1M6B464_9BACT|nr:P-loop NTPase fold protein [Hymenobacter daecheongensis]SHI43398.1 hypothetical protein SAMN02745146_0865 [Hymenobacter daecheongensis DSM 21074]
MAKRFSPSVNIVRDATHELSYLPTPNAKAVFGQLVNNYLSGTHCFNIVGAYGTGKSAFLWAFEQTLMNKKTYFQSEVGFKNVAAFKFEHYVGQYASLKETLAQRFMPDGNAEANSKAVINALDKEYHNLAAKQTALVLVIDEFGKFLEYAANENPDEELYFIQELAEYINDSSKEILLLTTVHQDFSNYGFALSRTQQQEWAKVKGRLKELPFNEPVEQLLYLAAQQLATSQESKADLSLNQQLFEAISAAKAFPLHDYFTPEVQRDVWPLDILSAAVMVLALQRYGQNERSLFSFLRSDDYLGLQDHPADGTYYGVSSVYDYLLYHYYSLLSSRHNPHAAHWASIKETLDLLEAGFHEKAGLDAARKLVKTIGLLSLFAPAGAELDSDFLTTYARLSLSIPNAEPILTVLTRRKLIRFVDYKKSYVLFAGTDLDIELAIDEAGSLVEQVTDVATRLSTFFSFPYVAAKRISFEVGTPRIFKIVMTEHPLLEQPQGEIDGYVNLIFSDTLTNKKLQELVGNRQDAILYGIYHRSGEIKKLIREIDKVQKVLELNINDRVASRELRGILEHQKGLLNHYVLDSLYQPDGHITWFFNGDVDTRFQGRRGFNRCLSDIAATVYPDTPRYLSELVNRTKLSTPILTARKSFIRALYDNWQEHDLLFPATNYPPEKTIYLSLLKATEMHQIVNGEYTLTPPANASFARLWDECEVFLQQSQEGKLPISDLMQILLSKPFKLKQGFVDFWVPVFLFIKRHDFALYGEQGRYIPELNASVVDLFTKSPSQYYVKAFALVREKLALFNDYRELLQLGPADRTSNSAFIESIKPFLTFYKKLPAYTRNTQKLSPEAKRLREAISKSKDPEAAFFETFPSALRFHVPELQQDAALRERYIRTLQSTIEQLRNAYSSLLQRLETFIAHNVAGTAPEFELYQRAMRERFQRLAPYQLSEEQKSFQDRLMSKLDDREAWLNSIANSLLGKSLQNFEDKDELVFQHHFQKHVAELDNLSELSSMVIDADKEEVFRLGISTFGDKEQARIIRRPKQLSVKDAELEADIRKLLGDDKQRSLIVLARLLKEQLENGE